MFWKRKKEEALEKLDQHGKVRDKLIRKLNCGHLLDDPEAKKLLKELKKTRKTYDKASVIAEKAFNKFHGN